MYRANAELQRELVIFDLHSKTRRKVAMSKDARVAAGLDGLGETEGILPLPRVDLLVLKHALSFAGIWLMG